MPEGPAIFPLWNGKKYIGDFVFYGAEPFGQYLYVPEFSLLKEQYVNGKTKFIKVRIIDRWHRLDKTTFIVQRVLDVRKKSKRQIAILNNFENGKRTEPRF